MEACATPHHWARELMSLGHKVRLIPPSYVEAYVKRSKNDATDAAAICEAVTRPSMRFVPIKTAVEGRFDGGRCLFTPCRALSGPRPGSVSSYLLAPFCPEAGPQMADQGQD
jgi:hypothetical protein